MDKLRYFIDHATVTLMYTRMTAVLILLLLCAVTAAYDDHSGVKIRLTEKAINYIGNIAKRQISDFISNLTIDELEEKTDIMYYSIKNTTIGNVSTPELTITLQPGQSGNGGVTVVASNFSFTVSTNYNVTYNLLSMPIIPIAGNIETRFDELDIRFGFLFTTGENYIPLPRPQSCTAVVHRLTLLFTGDFAWLLNLLQSLFQNQIKQTIETKICGVILAALETDATDKIRHLQLLTPIVGDIVIDYTHTSPIKIAHNYLEGQHLGEVYWKNGRSSTPLNSPELPEFQVDNSRMLYLLMSLFTAKTFAMTVHNHDFLKYTFTRKKVLPAVSDGPAQDTLTDFLNTTCTSDTCVGSIIPELGRSYPNSLVKVVIKSKQVPDIIFAKNNVTVITWFNMDVYVRTIWKDWTKFLNLLVRLKLTATAIIENGRITANITDSSSQIRKTSYFGEYFYSTTVNKFYNSLLDTYILPQLKRIASLGLPLPSLDGVTLVNSSLSILDDAVFISTDAVFTQV